LYLDPKNKHKIAPGVLVFKLSFGQSSTIDKYEGVNKIWKLQSSTNVVTHNVPTSNGYLIESRIPWVELGGKPDFNTRIGFNMELREKGQKNYLEGIPSNDSNKPFTWSTIKLK
jgi:hypothetical protein